MKRLSLAIIFACFTLAVAAQEGFRVDYQGTRPTIKDFVKAYALPRTGKDIIVTTWHEDGKKTQKTLKWNGHVPHSNAHSHWDWWQRGAGYFCF